MELENMQIEYEKEIFVALHAISGFAESISLNEFIRIVISA